MTYEELLVETVTHGLIVKEKPLRAHKGRIKGNRVAIKQDLNYADKRCTLIEELGHYHTTVGNILDQSKVINRKQERHARAWAYNRLIGITGIIDAYKHGCRNKYEMAEYLSVSEQFLKDAITYYYEKYGLYYEIDNYMLYFNPLGVFKKLEQISYVEKRGEYSCHTQK